MKSYTLILFFTFLGSLVTAQNFYDLNQIETIEITFAESNWDQLLDNEYAGDGGYILAQSVTLNGVVFDSVGVKYKGNSTYSSNQAKNPFHIELDTYKDHEYEGYTDIKLSNAAKDPSFIREVLSYHVIRQYMDAPLSNYANVYVNGELIGLYSNSESISKKFVNKYFNSKTGTRVKCNPIDGAGPTTRDYPNLVYLGEDSTAYYEAYEMKSDYGWDELIDLCDTLANHTDEIEKILDVDRALWMLALNNVLVNLDSYIGAFSQNYYLYRDETGRFLPVIWDLNESFGGFTMTGSSNLNNTTSKQQMSHLLHENDSDFPLIQKLLSVPAYKRIYLAHYKTIIKENFENGSYAETGKTLQELIDFSVQQDNNKFYSYNNFIDNLNSDVSSGGPGPGGNATVGITNLMDSRADYVLSLSDFLQEEPIITNIVVSNESPSVDETITINATVTNENNVYLSYRNDEYGIFQKVQMFDDGLHNDGAADDDIYGIDILIDRTLTQYYIYAENDNIAMFSPQRAEHEFYSIDASITSLVSDVVINEFLASNDITQADQDGDFDDWIELYNTGSSAVELEGYFLSDDVDDLMQWNFPAGATIEPNSYLIVWADDDEDQEGLHANFKLSASGESIFLVSPDGEILDEVNFPEQTTDISYGRFPNGTGDFQVMEPTYNAENTVISSTSELLNDDLNFKVYPNPAGQQINISSDEIITSIAVYNSAGNKVISAFPNNTAGTFDINHLSNGMYILNANTKGNESISQIFIKTDKQ